MTKRSLEKEALLSASRLRELLSYDPASGVFRWLVCVSPFAPVGSIAGHSGSQGYRRISIGEKIYLAHRLAWLHVHGEWPKDQVDHIDGDTSNNAISNLREAVKAMNSANQKLRRDSKSGLKGVQKHQNRWAARISINGVRKRIGLYETPEAAHAAYMEAAKRAYGEFARAA